MLGSEPPDGHVFFPGDHRLEGILEWPEPRSGVRAGAARGADAEGAHTDEDALARGGVVIAHPYPPHGATMAQPVVYRIAQSSRQHGLATLRFNFRGVEGSQGTFSGTEEYRDVQAAAAFLANTLATSGGGSAHVSRSLPLALAGYSFGAVMTARAAAHTAMPVQALALVGFVVAWENTPPDTLERLAAYRGPVLAVCAENDDLGYPEDVERVLTKLGLDFRLSVVEGTGHFLEGKHRQVGETVAAFLAEVLGGGQRA